MGLHHSMFYRWAWPLITGSKPHVWICSVLQNWNSKVTSFVFAIHLKTVVPKVLKGTVTAPTAASLLI